MPKLLLFGLLALFGTMLVSLMGVFMFANMESRAVQFGHLKKNSLSEKKIHPKITGQDEFKKITEYTLSILEQYAPEDYRYVHNYISELTLEHFSHTDVYKGKVFISPKLASRPVQYALRLAHEACYIEMCQAYKETCDNMGKQEVLTCLKKEKNVFQKLEKYFEDTGELNQYYEDQHLQSIVDNRWWTIPLPHIQ